MTRTRTWFGGGKKTSTQFISLLVSLTLNTSQVNESWATYSRSVTVSACTYLLLPVCLWCVDMVSKSYTLGWWWIWDSMFLFQYTLYKPAEFWMEDNWLICKPRKWCYNSYRCKISPTHDFLYFSQFLNVGFAFSVKIHFLCLPPVFFLSSSFMNLIRSKIF